MKTACATSVESTVVDFPITKQAAHTVLSDADRAVLVTQIDTLARTLSQDFHQMPPRAQAGALELGHTLASLRLTLVEMQKES